jgi:hypothetical protein
MSLYTKIHTVINFSEATLTMLKQLFCTGYEQIDIDEDEEKVYTPVPMDRFPDHFVPEKMIQEVLKRRDESQTKRDCQVLRRYVYEKAKKGLRGTIEADKYDFCAVLIVKQEIVELGWTANLYLSGKKNEYVTLTFCVPVPFEYKLTKDSPPETSMDKPQE